MSDIRLPQEKFKYKGKEYILRCNMNVLADIQEENGGTIPDIFDEQRTMKNFLVFLSAMMNDYADEMGWEERFTPKSLGREMNFSDGMLIQAVMKLVIRANYAPATEESSGDEGN